MFCVGFGNFVSKHLVEALRRVSDRRVYHRSTRQAFLDLGSNPVTEFKPETERRLREILEREEGIKHEVYLDHLGYPTCGIGHLITEADEEYGYDVGTPVSEERVTALFEADLKIVDDDCWNLFDRFEDLPDNIQLVCAAMAFQLGRNRLSGFKKFRAAVNEGRWSDAVDEMIDSRWYRQTTARADRMIALVREVE